MGLIADIGPGAVAVDSAPFIYFIEDDPRYAPLIRPLFEQADRGERLLVTSALTLLEVLVVPLRAGNRQLASATRHCSQGPRHPRGGRHARTTEGGGAVTAATGVKTPDALQLAAALAQDAARS